MDRSSIVAELRASFADTGSDITAAWLFGSVARGTAREDSDLDVAILRYTSPAPRRIEDLPVDLAERLARRLARPVDVIDVAHAPADLVHRVLRDGILLVDRDKSRRIRFEVAARNRYFDMTPIWRRYRRMEHAK